MDTNAGILADKFSDRVEHDGCHGTQRADTDIPLQNVRARADVGQELIEVFKCMDSPVAQFPTLWSQFQTRLASLEERCVQFLFQAAYLIAQSGRMALHHGRGLPDIFSLRCVIEGPETLNEVAI